MELRISENQLKNLIKQTLKSKELGEQEEPVNPEPESGTSDKQTGAAGYPSVGKWESGVSRGPANQIGVTKWSDVVGTNLKRGKANQLKEQEGMSGAMSDVMNTMGKFTPSPEDYNLDNFLKSVKWDDWGQIGLLLGSIAVATFVPGAQGLWISIGLDLIAASDQLFRQKDTLGAELSVAFAFVPFIGRYLPKFTNVSKEVAGNLMKKFVNVNSYDDIVVVMKTLPKQERYLVQELVKLIKDNPNKFKSIVNNIVSKQITTKQNAIKIADNINRLLKLGPKRGGLDKVGAEKIWKNLDLRRFGLDLGISTGLQIGGWTYEAWANKNMNRSEIPKDVLFYYKENINLIKKINKNDFDNKVTPIIKKYEELAYTNEIKFLKLYNFILKSYLNNPNSDFDNLIKKNYNNF